jgi:hypothetical protein
MEHIKKLSVSNKRWVAVFAALIVCCVLSIILIKNIGGRTAVIYKDGEEIARVDLSRVTESYTIPLDGNVILVESGSIRMQSADCPDQICVHQGALHDAGRIVCLPNRVLIEMQHTKDAPDAKAG